MPLRMARYRACFHYLGLSGPLLIPSLSIPCKGVVGPLLSLRSKEIFLICIDLIAGAESTMGVPIPRHHTTCCYDYDDMVEMRNYWPLLSCHCLQRTVFQSLKNSDSLLCCDEVYLSPK